jgi:hypothetical protein
MVNSLLHAACVWRILFSNDKLLERKKSTCELRDGAPAAMAVLGNVVHELLVLLRRPQPPPQLLLVVARLIRHAGQ